MGQKERRSVKEPTPSVHSLSSSDVSTSDVSSDDSSSVHERSTPKIAAVIIITVFIVAILVGVTVYFIDAKRVMGNVETVIEVIEDGPAEKPLTGNESLKQFAGLNPAVPAFPAVPAIPPEPEQDLEDKVGLVIEEEAFYDENQHGQDPPAPAAADQQEKVRHFLQHSVPRARTGWVQ